MSGDGGPPKLSFGFKPTAIKPVGAAASKPGGLAFGKPVASTSKPTLQPPRQAAKPSAFGADADDDEEVMTLETKRAAKAGAPVVALASKMTKAQREQQQAQLELDANVFAYDEVYDNMKESTRIAEQKRKEEAGDRKPKYIGKLLETAAQRQLDRARAEDKMIAKEREREGDMYADKDSFTTNAYLEQQEELRKVEEEDAKKEAAGGGKKGLATFLKEYLDTTSALHDAAVQGAAAASADKRVFTVAPPPQEKTDAQIAAEVEASTGRKVQLNEDGQIIDHRELMSGGLNVSKKPKKTGVRTGGFALSIAERKAEEEANKEPERPAINTADARERARKARERNSRLVEQQMLELEKKRKAEEEIKRDEAVKKLTKRNDNDRIAEAKRRAEERRRAREAEVKPIVDIAAED